LEHCESEKSSWTKVHIIQQINLDQKARPL